MNKIKTGHWEADGGIVNIPIGFIPDYFMMATMISTPIFYHWWRSQESEEASGQREGIIEAQTTHTLAADDAGITAYEADSQTPTITDYATLISESTTPTAKTATAPGTYAKPSVGNAQDRGSIYECVTSSSTALVEPTWPSIDGAQVTDSAGNVWEKVNVSRQRGGYQGVIIEDNIQTDGEEMYYVALQSNWDVDHGDVDGWTSGIDPDA